MIQQNEQMKEEKQHHATILFFVFVLLKLCGIQKLQVAITKCLKTSELLRYLMLMEHLQFQEE